MAKKTPPKNIVNFGDLKSIWKIVSKNWYIPIITVLVAWLISFFYSYKLTDVYQARTQILLRTNTEYYTGSVIADKSYYGNTYQSYIDNSNEMRVITSYDLISEAVSNLSEKLQVSYFIVGKIKTTEQFEFVPFEVKVNNVNSFLVEKRIQLSILDTSSYRITYTSKDGSVKAMKGEFGKELIDIDFNIRINKSEIANRHTINSLKMINYEFQIHSLPYIVSKFQSEIAVENPEYTNIITINKQDIIPERAILFLDTLIQIYNRNTLKLKIEINRNTLRYINRQMDTIDKKMDKYRDTIKKFKEVSNILGELSRQESEYFKDLEKLDNQIQAYQMQIKAMDDLEDYIIEDKDPQFLPPSVYLIKDDAFMGKAVDKLYQAQIRLNSILLSAKIDNPVVINLKDDIKEIKLDLLVYLNNVRKADGELIKNCEEKISEIISNIKAIPDKQSFLSEKERFVRANSELYNFLLQKKVNTEIAGEGIIPDTKVLESPRSVGIVMPDKKKIAIQFILAGFFLGALIVAIRVLLFTRIESPEELKEKTELPIIGQVPIIKNLKPTGILIDEEPRSLAAEAFRTIRTNIQYMKPEPGSKVILITSHAPGEGKTFTTINLAAMLAKGSKRVLILELDMHKPRVQKALEMTPDKGISSVIIGLNKIDEAVKHTSVENLDVILSGPIPPNPSDLILSQELSEIIKYGKEHYDYVFIDTPPAGLMSDALFLMSFSDIVLFVLNSKFTTSAVIKQAELLVTGNEIKNFAFLMNGVAVQRRRYYYNKYGYGYGYGHGYGYGSYGYGGYGYGAVRKK